MANRTIRNSILEGDNPYDSSRLPPPDLISGAVINLLGAKARYQIDGRNIEVYWSHWTGWESYAVDGRAVSGFRNWSMRHRERLQLNTDGNEWIEIESSVMPVFRVRIWRGGKLIQEDNAPVKRAFDLLVAALLASSVAGIAFVCGWLI